MHCQDYDCLHEGAVVHAMATLLPAALALAWLDGPRDVLEGRYGYFPLFARASAWRWMPTPTPTRSPPKRAVIRPRDGTKYEWQCANMLPSLARAEAVIDLVDRLETIPDMRELSALLVA